MPIYVLDLETTGLDPATADIVELATVTVHDMFHFSSLVRPEVPIEFKAMAAHHITERMIKNAPDLKAVIGNSHLSEATHLVAHNAEFDRGFIEKSKLLPELPWVCTWRCARHIWPDAPSHSNQVLRYWLPDLDEEVHFGITGDVIMSTPPHRAMPDAWVTAHILKRMLVDHTIDELVELTKQPILSKVCHFGMHREIPWEKVPKSYLHWMLKQKPGFDPDTVFTVKHFLEYCPHCQNGCKECGGTGFKYPLRVAEEVT